MYSTIHLAETRSVTSLKTIHITRPFSYSARSRVRGTLEVYHAYIRDLDASDASSTTTDQDWDILNASEATIEADTVAQNNV